MHPRLREVWPLKVRFSLKVFSLTGKSLFACVVGIWQFIEVSVTSSVSASQWPPYCIIYSVRKAFCLHLQCFVKHAMSLVSGCRRFAQIAYNRYDTYLNGIKHCSLLYVYLLYITNTFPLTGCSQRTYQCTVNGECSQ